MLNRLLPSSRRPANWFSRARWIAFSVAALMIVATIALVLAASFGWVRANNATFAVFSLLPLAALLAIQTAARLQEIVTMRAGGLAVDTGDDGR